MQLLTFMNDYIPIVFCFSSNYVSYTLAATYSLAISTKSRLKIYWLVSRLEDLNLDLYINNLKFNNIEIKIISADESRFVKWKTAAHVNTSGYLRLLVPDLIPESKVIYLDCDVIVRSDLSELYNLNLIGNVLAGVVDFTYELRSTNTIPLTLGEPYLNAGVLLLDLKTLKEDRFLDKCESIHNNYYESIIWSDQCIINKYAEGRKLIIDKKWNFQVDSISTTNLKWDSTLFVDKTKILHFSGSIKPWQEWCNPLIKEYWWKFVKPLNFTNLQITKITNLQEMIYLSSALDCIERFEESSRVKTFIINQLIQNINK